MWGAGVVSKFTDMNSVERCRETGMGADSLERTWTVHRASRLVAVGPSIRLLCNLWSGHLRRHNSFCRALHLEFGRLVHPAGLRVWLHDGRRGVEEVRESLP